MKALLLASIASYAGLVGAGVCPCPCEMVSGSIFLAGGATCSPPTGLYVEARDATVWGGACHVSSEARTGGSHAVMGWAFESGAHAGVDLSGVRVAAALEGAGNLAAGEVFNLGESASRRAALWIDAPADAQADAAEAYIRSLGVLGEVVTVARGPVEIGADGDAFLVSVAGVIELAGEALPDRSCCTMPEARWYPTLARTSSSVVGVPGRCAFEGGVGPLGPWAFEEENSAYVGRFGA
ncbi:MAG: DUF1326 domain-containing protein [Planctomycetota bacterium]|nr:DUF1326 domain-containing protein [Planctomycetota bacterium]